MPKRLGSRCYITDVKLGIAATQAAFGRTRSEPTEETLLNSSSLSITSDIASGFSECEDNRDWIRSE